jgi:hypothetical protein
MPHLVMLQQLSSSQATGHGNSRQNTSKVPSMPPLQTHAVLVTDAVAAVPLLQLLLRLPSRQLVDALQPVLHGATAAKLSGTPTGSREAIHPHVCTPAFQMHMML